LDRRVGGPQSRSGRRGEKSWPYSDSKCDSTVAQPVASRNTDCAIPAPFQAGGPPFICFRNFPFNTPRWYPPYLEVVPTISSPSAPYSGDASN
jgi:hypothetical protein